MLNIAVGLPSLCFTRAMAAVLGPHDDTHSQQINCAHRSRVFQSYGFYDLMRGTTEFEVSFSTTPCRRKRAISNYLIKEIIDYFCAGPGSQCAHGTPALEPPCAAACTRRWRPTVCSRTGWLVKCPMEQSVCGPPLCSRPHQQHPRPGPCGLLHLACRLQANWPCSHDWARGVDCVLWSTGLCACCVCGPFEGQHPADQVSLVWLAEERRHRGVAWTFRPVLGPHVFCGHRTGLHTAENRVGCRAQHSGPVVS